MSNTPTEPSSELAVFTFWQKRKPETKEWILVGNDAGIERMIDTLSALEKRTGGGKIILPLNTDVELTQKHGNPRRAEMIEKLVIQWAPQLHEETLSIAQVGNDLHFEIDGVTLKQMVDALHEMQTGYSDVTFITNDESATLEFSA